jgi:diguanylate cyclase (GGDEF)-like protein/PAS domain S-box-containing protein
VKSIARKKIEGRIVGGNFADLANYSDLFQRTHDCILLLDASTYEVLQCNPACARTLGVATEDLVDQRLVEFFDEFTRARLEQFLAQAVAKPAAHPASQPSIDLRWASTSVELTLELTASPLRLADYCTVIQLIARDVTAIRAQQKTLESLSTTDELTGLNNRRALNQHLDRVHASQQSYAVLLMDVDNFKHFNDRNGHAAGDAALKEIGRILGPLGQEPGVFAARYGGEEFTVVVSPAPRERVDALAERIRATVQASQVPHAEAQPLGFLSVSIGVAESREGQSALETAKLADEALYASKEAGRNRVTRA